MDRQRGTVKWFSREKGWGFIRLESGEDVFVHHSDIEGEGFVNLEDDEPVEFSIEEREKGPRARHVRSLAGTGGGAKADPGAGTGAGAGSGAGAGADARSGADAGAGADAGTRGGPSSGAESASTERRPSRRGDGGRDESREEGRDGPPPLAEQLRRRLGSLFPGLGD